MLAKIIKKLTSLITLLVLLAPIEVALGADFTVSPLIIDHKTQVRDILTKDITLKNHSDKSLRLYVSVNEIQLGDNNEIMNFTPASMGDRTVSITSWVSISRARITIKPHEEAVIPVTVKINPKAVPGDYHAFIGFADASNIDEAEKIIMSGQGQGVVLRVSIEEKLVELLKLTRFDVDPVIFDDSDHNFLFTVANDGDQPITPSGELIIYDSRGIELQSLAINSESKTINPGEKVDFLEPVPFMGGLGKNKAYLSIQYGKNNLTTINDTSYYYSVPWMYLFIMILLLLVIPITFTILFKRLSVNNNSYSHDEAREVAMYVRNSHDHQEHNRDINLKKNDS